MVWQATIPAVSVRNLEFPKLTGLNPLAKAKSISLELKSPSGPININEFSETTDCKFVLSCSSQCAIKQSESWILDKNSLNEIDGFKIGN